MTKEERNRVRDLAKQYMGICNNPVQSERRHLWRRHNSLKETRPPIYIRAFAWNEMVQAQSLVCEDGLCRRYEDYFKQQLFWHSLNDDSVFEPWVTVDAVRKCNGWGVSGRRHRTGDAGGSFKDEYPIKQLEDIEKLRRPWHEIDESATAAEVRKVQDLLGDVIPINVDRGPAYRMWSGDISTDIGHLRGIENFMMDMMDSPEWCHRLLSFLSDGVRKTHDQAEDAGDWGLGAHQNQAMPYAEELEAPAPNVNGVRRKQLWGYMAAQEFTGVSPGMHDEFLLQYQLPILKQFGLVAYGCCEDLTNKIDILRQIPNLRRIAVSPFADPVRCAEQIGRDYVISYRPSPADMVSYDLDADSVRSILKRDLTAIKGCHVDVTLKDVQTVQSDPDRIRNWVALTRALIDEIYG